MDKLTARPPAAKAPLFGLLNVNTASKEALASVPGIGENTAQQIVDTRQTLDTDILSTTAWLYTAGVLDADAFKSSAPGLTSRGFQYHLHVVGYGVPCGQFRVVEAIVDLAGRAPRISYLRDLTRLGMPFALEEDAGSVQR
jgi:type II secretory pathway component PulK